MTASECRRTLRNKTLNQGKLVIVFIFGLSAVMGGYAWWHHFTQGRQCVEFWGAEAAEMIRYAPVVEVMKLAPLEADDMETIQIQGEPYAVSASKDITETPGLVHARQALIEDASFLWEVVRSGPTSWQYVLRFADGDQQISVALDGDQGRVVLVGTDRQATLKPHLATAYQSRLPKWLGVEVAEPVTAATD
jgi:hypothetical protein